MYITQRISNFGGRAVRYEMLEGRKHLVVPTAMLTHGVHNGSGGPLYYPEDELRANISGWNHKPIIVYHPDISGSITACDQRVINRQKVGVILNTYYDGKLRCEAWIDIQRCAEVDQRVLNQLAAKRIVEVSTGLSAKVRKSSGVFNNKTYTGITHGYEPDHLAILPDQRGACSVKDGAGLMQLNSSGKKAFNVEKYITKTVGRMLANIHNGDEGDGGSWVTIKGAHVFIDKEGNVKHGPDSLKGKTFKKMNRKQSRAVMKSEVNKDLEDDRKASRDEMLLDFQDKYADHRSAGKTHKESVNKLFANFPKDAHGVVHTGELIRSARQWKKDMREQQVNNSRSVTTSKSKRSEIMKVLNRRRGAKQVNNKKTPTRDDLVDLLIENHGWEEEDRRFLTKINDERFARILNSTLPNEEDEDDDEDDDGEELKRRKVANKNREERRTDRTRVLRVANKKAMVPADDTADDESDPAADPCAPGMKKKKRPIPTMNREGGMRNRSRIMNRSNRELTAEQFCQGAPPQLRDLLLNGLELQEQTRQDLIEEITNNDNCIFDETYLNSRSTQELRGILAMAGGGDYEQDEYQSEPTSRALYFGAAGPIGNSAGGGREVEQEILSLPVMNFGADDEEEAPRKKKKLTAG